MTFVPVTLGSPRFHTVEVDSLLITDAWFPPLLTLPPHVHERPCFAVMLDGSFDVLFTRRVHKCTPAVGIIEPAGERHGNQVERAGAHVLVVQPDPAREELLRHCGGLMDRVECLRDAHLALLGRRLSHEIQEPDTSSPLVLEACALELLATATRYQAREGRRRRPPRWLLRAQELLHARFNDRLGAAEVAGAVGVHPVHLARSFRAHFGKSMGVYVRALRLEWAARRLSRTNDSLAAIAVAAGFSDQSHFSRSFKRFTGLTPARYRERSA
jgi:AraC family transcriptional regulator